MPVEIDSGNTAWVLAAAALVMFMTPGLGFFYAGFTRSKNVLGTIMQSFIVVGLVGIQWVVIGYSLAFSPDTIGGLIGDLDFFGLKNVGLEPSDTYATTIPHEAFMIFQAMFAIITPALITGAFAERAKFSTFLVFMLAWSFLVYDPVAHWVFSAEGWLSAFDLEGIDALDFAGGTAIHVNAGAAALAAAILFGRRKGYGKEPMEPHNVTYIVLGAAILWFGWFGFNAGSAGAASGQAANAFVVTNTAAAAAALSWMLASWALTGKASVIGAAAGAVAGLVAITPASGFVQPMESIVIGGVAGALCYLAVRLRTRTRLDDSLDVVAVHGVGGTWGALATGIFAFAGVSGVAQYEGLTHGNGEQILDQLIAIGVVWVYSFTVTAIILKVLDMTMGLRVNEEEEDLGLDVTQHGERGYVMDETGSLAVTLQAKIQTPIQTAAPLPRTETAESGA